MTAPRRPAVTNPLDVEVAVIDAEARHIVDHLFRRLVSGARGIR
jgi:hypothetical protein